MMRRLLGVAAIACGLATTAGAQDPTKTLPNAYTLELANDYVEVVRVHYDAGAKLPEHTHAAGTTVYVYLDDSEGVIFRHVGGSNSVVTRPAVAGGAMRIAAGREEHHTAENASSTASDFLRIWFKTDNGGVQNLRQRLSPADNAFSNKQMRITRTSVPPGQKTLVEAKDHPALRIVLRPGLKDVKSTPADYVRWLDKGTTEEFSVSGEIAMDVIKIDFLTKPTRR